jgi:hypothetical protein
MENKYIVYIDESNILSRTGNSVYTAVYIKFLNKDYLSQQIQDIEINLKIPYTHWSDMPWKIRLKFAQKIKSMNLLCKIIIYKNPIVQENILEDFLPKVIEVEDDLFKIVIDGNKGKDYELKLKRLLKEKVLKSHKVIFMNDKNEPLVRLADFMAGLLRSYIDNKNIENDYIYRLLKDKIKILN